MDNLPPLPEGAESTQLPPLPEGAVSSEGGAAFVSPKGMGTPAREETKQRVSDISQQVGEYLFAPPTREDFSALGIGGGAVTGAGVMAGAPKLLKSAGKAAKFVPFVGPELSAGLQGLGTAMEAAPLARRAMTGALGGAAGETVEQAGEYEGIPRIATIPASLITAGAITKAADVVGRALSREGTKLSEQLREFGIDKVKDVLQKAGYTKYEAENIIRQNEEIQRQLAQRATVAGERAKAKQIYPLKDIREIVADKINRAKVEAGYAADRAGMNAAEKAKIVNDAEQKIVQANQSLDNLEQQLLSRPGISKEQFGKQIRDIADDIWQRGSTLRETESNIQKVINESGNYLRIPTNNLAFSINKFVNLTRSDANRNVAQKILNNIYTFDKRGNPISALTMKSADSLKNSVQTELNAANTAKNKELITFLTGIKDDLESSFMKYPAYQQALNRYAQLSRPLDIVEKHAGREGTEGALYAARRTDPFNLERRLTEAEVVGGVIERARAGNKVLIRLLSEDPSIKDAGRLYFTRELFGKEVVPTDAVMRTFLQNYEEPLKQLGLYNEFRNINVAKRTALQAIDDAKQFATSAQKEYTSAEEASKFAKKEYGKLQKQATTAKERLSIDLNEPIEKALQRSAARAKPAEVKAEQAIRGAQKTIDEQQSIINKFSALESDLLNKKVIEPREVASKINQLTEDLYAEGSISLEKRNATIAQINKNINQFADKDKAIKTLRRMGVYLLGASTVMGVGKYLTPQAEVISNR